MTAHKIEDLHAFIDKYVANTEDEGEPIELAGKAVIRTTTILTRAAIVWSESPAARSITSVTAWRSYWPRLCRKSAK